MRTCASRLFTLAMHVTLNSARLAQEALFSTHTVHMHYGIWPPLAVQPLPDRLSNTQWYGKPCTD